MSENGKTMTFLAVAALAVVLAWEPWRHAAPMPEEDLAGTKLFPKLDDALTAKSMEILEYDANTASLRPFEIAQVGGLWSIPSHNNYPADAREHLAEAATSLMGVEILSVVSSSPGEHETYGVIDPGSKTLKPGMEGVGTRVTLKDAGKNPLANLIIGHEVKDKPNLRYVRRVGQDQVFMAAVKTDKLSTKFEDWIEKDLLKLNTFDIRQVLLNDYSIQTRQTLQGLVGYPMHRSRMKLAYDDEKGAWNLAELIAFDPKTQDPKPAKLAADEELNTEKLNAMKTALDDLQIVDVERKPDGLSGELRATDQFIKNQEAVESLGERGFHAYPTGGKIDILSSEGEAIVGMKDGVEYVLRFGEIASSGADKKSAPKDSKNDKAGGSNVSRYLFVMARFNPELIDKPKLEFVPSASPDKKQTAVDAGAAKDRGSVQDSPAGDAQDSGSAAEPKTGAKPAPAGKASAAKEAGSAEDSSAAEDSASPDNSAAADDSAAASDAAPDAPADVPSDDGAAGAAKKPSSAKPARGPAAGRLKNISGPVRKPGATNNESRPVAEKESRAVAEKESPAAAAPAAAPPAAEQKPASAEDEKIAAVEKENKRRQDDYDSKVKKGKEHVKELNDRFADWYYHISDDVYQKIHLGRADAIKKKEKPAGEGNSVSDLKELEKGLDTKVPGAKK